MFSTSRRTVVENEKPLPEYDDIVGEKKEPDDQEKVAGGLNHVINLRQQSREAVRLAEILLM